MNILAIDPGLNKMAACFMGEDVKHYVVPESKFKGLRLLDKIACIYTFTRGVLNSTNTDIIIMEDYPYKLQGSRTLRVAEVKGVIYSAIADIYWNKAIVLMQNPTWKAYLPTELKGIKKTTQEYIDTCNRINGTDFVINDQVDAYYMAYTATQISKGDVRTDGAKNLYKKITGKDYTGNVGTV